jgi:hypothetical protein
MFRRVFAIARFTAVPTLLLLVTLVSVRTIIAAEASLLESALNSINAIDAKRYVSALADDTFEGREAGSRGGRAAGLYIVQQLQKAGLVGGNGGSFYQPFGTYSNIIAMVEGTDPDLKNQCVLVGAHYDHVGYGTRTNSYGPVGYIHNGADDNASGVAGTLEIAQAFGTTGLRLKRSVLFCFWDGEEKGLYGSKHWVKQPTVPLNQVALAINTDMIGRLRNSKIDVYGVRTAPGLRRLAALANDDPAVRLFFNWEIKENSDHFSFIEKNIPTVMFHTGLHDDYHRPSDDVQRINYEGIESAARLMFRFIAAAGDATQLGSFRNSARMETPGLQQALDFPASPLPSRLGLSWNEQAALDGDIVVTKVIKGSAADKAGIQVGDQIESFAGKPIESANQFRLQVLAAKNPVTAEVRRTGQDEPLPMTLELAGNPTRLGISWRLDDAEPGTLIVNRVIPGSAAALAGIRVNDRIYQADGNDIKSTESFQQTVADTNGELTLLVEGEGRPRTVVLQLPSAN